MKAAILKEYSKPIVIEEVPEPRVRANEVLVRVKACGICGTDVKTCTGKKDGIKLPLILGHEIAGEIVELGAGVESLKVGDRGIVYFYVSCGTCRFCLHGRETICEHPIGRFGFSLDGGLTEYMSVPVRNFIPIPDNVPFEHACIIPDAIATTYGALKKAAIVPGEYVLVMGLGGLGMHAVQIAKSLGANVIGVDVDPAKLEVARKLGVQHLVRFDSDADKFMEAVVAECGGDAVSAILETVSSPATVDIDLKLLDRAGRLVLLGYSPTPLIIPPYTMVLKELSILGSRASTREDNKAVVEMVSEGRVAPIIGATYSIDQVNLAINNLKAGTSIGRQIIKM